MKNSDYDDDDDGCGCGCGFNFEPPFSMIICASSGSGKTTLLKSLIDKKWKSKNSQNGGFKKNIFIFCPTLDYSGDFDDYTNDDDFKNRIYNEYNENTIGDIIKEQEYVINRYGKNRCPNTLIILDDCLLELQKSNNIVKNLFFKGRHLKLSVIILVQKLKGISTIIRVNTKYMIFFRCGNTQELENLLDEYTGKRERKKIEEELIEHFKKPWSFVICNFKSQDFKTRYLKGVSGKTTGYIKWYDD